GKHGCPCQGFRQIQTQPSSEVLGLAAEQHTPVVLSTDSLSISTIHTGENGCNAIGVPRLKLPKGCCAVVYMLSFKALTPAGHDAIGGCSQRLAVSTRPPPTSVHIPL